VPRYALAVVVFCLSVGGAAGLMLHQARRDATAVPGVAESSTVARFVDESTDAAREAQTGAGASAERAEVGGAEAGGEAEDGAAAPTERARRRASGGRGPTERGGRGGGPRAARVYLRVSRRQAAAGGRGVAGQTVRGVKKTGAAIGKTFGKIGGVFND
jgi:hypothetical protein